MKKTDDSLMFKRIIVGKCKVKNFKECLDEAIKKLNEKEALNKA